MQLPPQLTQPLADALPGPASSLLRNESDFLSGLIAAPAHLANSLGEAGLVRPSRC